MSGHLGLLGGGTFALTFDGATTSAIDYNAIDMLDRSEFILIDEADRTPLEIC